MKMNCDRPVHVSLGSYGRLTHEQAIALALTVPPEDPLLGRLSTAHLQLCPQNRGRLDVEMAACLRDTHPAVAWRLHANVQVERHQRIVDLCDWPEERDWFVSVAAVSNALGASAYTAHAGQRCKGTVQAVLNHVRNVEQLFGVPVGVEGHYPTRGNTWLFSSWEEYRLLLASGVHYALDLSHLHILACQSGQIERALVAEMLASSQCLELHVSGNDGRADQHQPLQEPPWWWDLLPHLHADAVVFSEGRQSIAF